MSLKWLGVICVVAGCGGFGCMMAWNVKRETRMLRQLLCALDFLSCELSFRMTPLPEALRKTAALYTGSIQAVFLRLAEELEQQIAPDVASCMEAVIAKTPELSKKASVYFRDLGRLLGNFDLSGQEKGLESIRKQCNAELRQLEDGQSQRVRSYQTLGLCAGAALAILLI